jgi:endoglucanase
VALAALAESATALLLAACGTTPGHGAAPPSVSPVTRLYVDPANPLFAGARQLKAEHQPAQAAELRALGETPAALWAAGQSNEMQQVKQVSQAAAKADEVAVIVAYDIPHRDACGTFSGSVGASAAYMTWVNQLAAAIGGGNDIVIVEPDALPDIVNGCLNAAEAAERYRLLRYAMSRLGRLPHAQVYLDAGNPGMFSDPAKLAAPLKEAGVQYGRGFSANVSNFQWTSRIVTWSQQLERAVGSNTRAVIDTSRNGNGPYTGPDAPQWCNPPGRAPGAAPTLAPGRPGISAYLWIKDPGVSDGPCNGGPAAGQFWPKYALELAQAGHFS